MAAAAAAAAARLAGLLHGHELDDEAGPAGEVLRPLALARLGVVLLPGEARVLPALVDRVDEVLAQAGEEVGGLGLVGAVLGGDVLLGCVLANFLLLLSFRHSAGRWMERWYLL